MKLITRNTDYAIRAVCALAKRRGKVLTVPILVGELKIPRPFLRKILQVLGSKLIIDSSRGIGGGFKLMRDPKKLYMLEIIEAFQGPFSLNECFLNKSLCPNRKTCFLKKKIDHIEADVLRQLKNITVADILKG